MMDNKKQLLEQIKVVIKKFEEDYAKNINSSVLQLIYKRYKKALEIVENNEDIRNNNILGGVRTYMDRHLDILQRCYEIGLNNNHGRLMSSEELRATINKQKYHEQRAFLEK